MRQVETAVDHLPRHRAGNGAAMGEPIMPRKRGKKGAKATATPSRFGKIKPIYFSEAWADSVMQRLSQAKGWTSASKRIEHRMARLGIDPLAPATAKGHLARGKARG